MSTDRELLELAAKAAGIEIEVKTNTSGEIYAWRPNPYWVKWTPLTDDGDALQLAGALLLSISIDSGYTRVIDQNERVTYEKGNGMVTTRRAIVRAAAEIGRAMP